MSRDRRGSIAFFGTYSYRPPVPLDIFSCPVDPPPSSADDELPLTDDKSYNQNGNPIPAAALKELLTFLGNKKDPPAKLSECRVTPEDAEHGRVTGMVFVSERDGGLETLHVALRSNGGKDVNVLSLGETYGADTFGGVRMEDSGCIAGGFKDESGDLTVGHSLVYVSTKETVEERRTPWTVVYKTNLADGRTERLTPPGQYDLSPAVSPSGKQVAVASFQQSMWNGEIENIKTEIVVMNVDKRVPEGRNRRVVIKDGGWPTWGSEKFIFFHRGFDTTPPSNTAKWAVFRYNMETDKEELVTPKDIDAMTPAAISDTKVAVATIRQKSKEDKMKVERQVTQSIGQKSKEVKMEEERQVTQYRHIEIFDMDKPEPRLEPVRITQRIRPHGDHYNPFVLNSGKCSGVDSGKHRDEDSGKRIGYHRCKSDKLLKIKNQATNNQETRSIQRRFDKVQPPQSHEKVGLFRVTGVFPSISKNGEKLAFVDNEFKAVWLADSKKSPRAVYQVKSTKSVFSTSWNQDDSKDTLYVCEGPAFSIEDPVQIIRIPNVSSCEDPDK